MSGYGTSRRALTSENYPWRVLDKNMRVRSSGFSIPLQAGQTDYGGLGIPMQVTYSYRTGKGSNSGPETLDRKSLLKDVRSLNRFDTGHEFETSTQSVVVSPSKHLLRNTSPTLLDQYYEGPIVLLNTRWGLNGNPQYVDAKVDLKPYGTTAIARCMPTNSVAALTEMLAELKREGIPSAPGQAIQGQGVTRGAGSEYLNMEFGYKPLANALASTATAVVNAAAISRQFRRDVGRTVRRSYTYPDFTSVQEWDNGASVRLPGLPASSLTGFVNQTQARVHENLRIERSVWFSGGFMYNLPQDDEFWDRLTRYESEANHLLGVRVSPDTLWNLAPWSWLSDWFVNIGDNLKVASSRANDGLVLKYGYVMCKTTTKHTYTITGLRKAYDLSRIPAITITFKQVRKQRVRATPFGFGLNPDSFTGRQWAILGALGLSKGPRTLP